MIDTWIRLQCTDYKPCRQPNVAVWQPDALIMVVFGNGQTCDLMANSFADTLKWLLRSICPYFLKAALITANARNQNSDFLQIIRPTWN
jgi:hypothetical protein